MRINMNLAGRIRWMGLLILCSNLAVGQENSAATGDTSLWELSMEEVVVTAQHEPTHYTNAVHKVKIIDGKKIEKLGMANLAEVLSTQLNMQVTTDLILGRGLAIQGISGENVQIMIDGVPIIGRLDGNIDLSQIQMNNVRRIEIIEGTMSTQFGSNASGGVINLITHSSQIPKFQIMTNNRIESKGILQNSLSAGWRTGSFYAHGSVNRYHSQLSPVDSLRIMEKTILEDGTSVRSKKYPWNPKLQWSAEGTARYSWNDSLSIEYTYRFFDEEVNSYGEKRRPEYKPYAFDDRYFTGRSDHSLTAKGYINERIYFSSIQALNYYDRNSLTFRHDFEDDVQSVVSGSHDTTGYSSFLSRNIINYSTGIGLDVQGGWEWIRESANGHRIKPSDDRKIASLINTAGWINLKYGITPEWTILGNMRYGYNSRFEHPLLLSIQTLWKPHPDWSIRAGYSQGYRAPSLKELLFEFIDVNHYILGNADLAAESSSHYHLDISTHLPLFGSEIKSGIGFFSNQIQNRIVLTEYQPAKYTYRNLENFSTHGVTLELEYPLTQNLLWKSGGGVTFLYNIFSEKTEAPRYYSLPEWYNALEIHWPMAKTDFLFTHKLTGRQQLFRLDDQGNITEGFIDGMNMVHGSASRSFFSNQLRLSLGVKNLFDVTSVAVQGSGTSGAHSGAVTSRVVHWGRSFFLGLKYTFSR